MRLQSFSASWEKGQSSSWENVSYGPGQIQKGGAIVQYTEKSALPLIEAAYSNMTQTEKTIARYFLDENEPDDLSLKNIASILAVSEATLVRFAKKCGFKGYREFVYQYGKSLEASKPSENIAQSSLQVLNAYQDLLTKSYSLIREEQIVRVAQMISDARRVYVGGIGSSGYAAQEMAYRFMRIGVGIEAFSDVDMMRMISVFRNEHDVVFGLSLSGARAEFLEYLRVAKERGAKTVLITSSPREYFHDFIDEVIIVPSLLHLNHGNLISPQFPLLVMIDILYAAYMRQNRIEKETLHGQTVRMVEGTEEEIHRLPAAGQKEKDG